MECEYCGHESAVPDASERRKQLEAKERKQEAERNRIAKQQRKAADREKSQREKRAREKAKRRREVISLPFKMIRGLLSLAIPLGIVGFILYQNGMLNEGIDMFRAWKDDPASAVFQQSNANLVARGYQPIMEPKVERLATVSFFQDHLQVQPGYCYLFTASSNALFNGAKLNDAKQKSVARQDSVLQTVMLEHCPQKADYYTAHLQLNKSAGSLTSQWFYKAAPPRRKKTAKHKTPKKSLKAKHSTSKKSLKVKHNIQKQMLKKKKNKK
ncbi:MAG: hypothetical protein GY854_23110 [Deltaproteobacteria bacterium]|nr:hypothetical protein [Deltaproteobacteria bacterium]